MSATDRSTTSCVDAGVVLRALVLPGDDAVQRLWASFASNQTQLVAPLLLRYEATNVLHRWRRAGRLDDDDVADGIQTVLDQQIEYVSEGHLHRRAAELANDHGLPAAYDAHYLAVAERLGVELWTTDAKLVNAVRERLPWVRLVG